MTSIARVRFDGIEVPVEIRGDHERSLLFLPGMGVHPRHYAVGLERLASHVRVVTPDLSFGTHRTLPKDLEGYLACVDTVAAALAPHAPRAGHSLGGLLALLGNRSAIALSPLIPLQTNWFGQVWRAVRLQLREYAGVEGARGVRWALAMLANYAAMALTAPTKLFPALAATHGAPPRDFEPTAPSARLVLGRYDHLYRVAEYEEYAAATGLGRDALRWLPLGHDWPVTRPDLMEKEVLAALGVSPGTTA